MCVAAEEPGRDTCRPVQLAKAAPVEYGGVTRCCLLPSKKVAWVVVRSGLQIAILNGVPNCKIRINFQPVRRGLRHFAICAGIGAFG